MQGSKFFCNALQFTCALIVLGPCSFDVKVQLCFTSLIYAQKTKHNMNSSMVNSRRGGNISKMFQNTFNSLNKVSNHVNKNNENKNENSTASATLNEERNGFTVNDFVSNRDNVVKEEDMEDEEETCVALKDVVELLRFLILLTQPGISSDIKMIENCLNSFSQHVYELHHNKHDDLKKQSSVIDKSTDKLMNDTTTTTASGDIEKGVNVSKLIPKKQLGVSSSNSNEACQQEEEVNEEGFADRFESNYTDGHEVESVAGYMHTYLEYIYVYYVV